MYVRFYCSIFRILTTTSFQNSNLYQRWKRGSRFTVGYSFGIKYIIYDGVSTNTVF